MGSRLGFTVLAVALLYRAACSLGLHGDSESAGKDGPKTETLSTGKLAARLWPEGYRWATLGRILGAWGSPLGTRQTGKTIMDRDTLRSVQQPLKQRYRERPEAGSIRAEGELDVRGTLGLDPDAPVGFSSIKLFFDLQTEASEQEIEQLVATTEKYCVVLQTLRSGLKIEVTATPTEARA